MSTWFTSDLHFGHANIITYTNRPFVDVHEMNEAIVATWNETVGVDDDVWVLGDVCMGNVAKNLAYVRRLNGNLTLIAGNHDKVFRRNGSERREEWELRYREAGFGTIIHGDIVHTLSDATTVRLCHFPYPGRDRGDERYADHRPVDDGLVVVHGHVHGRWRRSGNNVDVGIDPWGGRLVREDELCSVVNTGVDLGPLPWVRTGL